MSVWVCGLLRGVDMGVLLIVFFSLAGNMQHSVWFVEVINSNFDTVGSSKTADALAAGVLSKEFLLRRIWQGKCAQSAASKVLIWSIW